MFFSKGAIPMSHSEWTATKILNTLFNHERREKFAAIIWTDEEIKEHHDFICRTLARDMRFRPQSIRNLPLKTRIQYLSRRLHLSDLEKIFKKGLITYHFAEQRSLMKDFLDACGIENDNGNISNKDYTVPALEKVRSSRDGLASKYSKEDIYIYLTTAGLSMDPWRDVLWTAMEEWAAAKENVPLTSSGFSTIANLGKESENKEDSAGFTTLDRILIQQIVAAVGETDGALSIDQVTDLVEEAIHLSSTRHRTYFHRSFLNTLLGLDLELKAPEENPSRRAWLLAGRISALERKSSWQTIEDLYQNQLEDIQNLLRTERDCATMVAPKLFNALRHRDKTADAVACLPPDVVAELGPKLIPNLLNLAGDAYRTRQVTETRLIVDLLLKTIDLMSPANVPPPPIVREISRRHAQCLKSEGHFAVAEVAFQKLAQQPSEIDLADIHTDLGLSLGRFKWLYEVEVPRQAHQVSILL